MFLSLPGFTDNVYTHLLAGLGAGIFAVCIGSPVDVVCSANALYLTISLILFDEGFGFDKLLPHDSYVGEIKNDG